MSRPTFLTIDLEALQHNLQRVHECAPHSSIIAMVKANAYGHGIVRAAKALKSADALGVASLDEGITLRDAGITQPIVLMEGVFYAEEIEEAAKHQFTLVTHHLPHVEMLEKSKVKHEFPVWLKINTGMNRLGVAPEDVASAHQRLNALSIVKKSIGLMTHFAEADITQSDATRSQIQKFNAVTNKFDGARSLANSAGILAWPEAQQDWVRPGLMLYGASPFADKMGQDHNLKPVMTLSSKLIAVNKVKKGDKVGYGSTWTVPEDMLIGIVGVGYGDGYPQYAKNGTPVLVNGIECSLAGRVSMDMLAVDLRHCAHAQVGDEVILWGRGLPVERVAKHSGTSAYEILTRMTPRPKIIERQ
jgi:alanine racemase